MNDNKNLMNSSQTTVSESILQTKQVTQPLNNNAPKGKSKNVALSSLAFFIIILLVIAFVSQTKGRNITQEQLIKNLSDVMQPVGYQLVPTDNMSDNSYFIYVKDSPNDTPRPNGILCRITEENGYVKSIILTSVNGSKGIPMSAMKFVSALNPKWSSSKVTKVMTEVFKEENVHDNGITYSFEDYGTSSYFLIELN